MSLFLIKLIIQQSDYQISSNSRIVFVIERATEIPPPDTSQKCLPHNGKALAR